MNRGPSGRKIVDAVARYDEAVTAISNADIFCRCQRCRSLVRKCRSLQRPKRVVRRWSLVHPIFDGIDEGDHVSGRGWAELTGDELHGRIVFHQGDDSAFTAHRIAHVTRQRRT